MINIYPPGNHFIKRDSMLMLTSAANIDYDKTEHPMTSWHLI